MRARKEALKEILRAAHSFGYELPLSGAEVALIYGGRQPTTHLFFLRRGHRNDVLVIESHKIGEGSRYLGWIKPVQLLKQDLPHDLEYHITWRLEEPPEELR